MQHVVPWKELVTLIAPYPREEHKGQPPFPVEILLRSCKVDAETMGGSDGVAGHPPPHCLPDACLMHACTMLFEPCSTLAFMRC